MAPREIGSWIEGTPAGLPSEDARRAPVGRRLVALAVDWVASMAVSALLFPTADPDALGGILRGDPLATLGVFAVSTTVLVGLLGTTIGHRLLRIRVVPVADASSDAGPVRAPGLIAAVVRTVLLCLVIPPVVWDGDGRGLHDVAARTAIVRA